MTNLYGARTYGENWNTIELSTLRAYFGLLLLAGVYRSHGECLQELWSEQDGRPIFRATMSLKTFKKINRCIRFDDKNERPDRSRDKLAPIRDVFDKWVHHLKMLYVPDKCVTVDEQLISFRGRCPFRQYIPSKPGRYGIKIWALCDSQSFYAYNMQVYTGRNPNCRPEINQGKRVVLDLTEGSRGRNVTCDNFFTSYDLAVELKKRDMTIVGTIRKNRKELPPLMINMKKKPVYHSEFVFDHTRKVTLVSYVPQTNRFVTLLSTVHKTKEVSTEEKKKPAIISYYNSTKGAVDTLDKMVATYQCKRKINRWPMAIFSNILDVSACNAFVLFTSLNPQWNSNKKSIRRRLFLAEVGHSLVRPYIASRSTAPRSS